MLKYLKGEKKAHEVYEKPKQANNLNKQIALTSYLNHSWLSSSLNI
jgi:hypothetical protein